jgi:hypothetical protein
MELEAEAHKICSKCSVARSEEMITVEKWDRIEMDGASVEKSKNRAPEK